MKKKWLGCILAAAMTAASLAGCGSGSEGSATTATEAATAAQTQAAAAVTTEAAAETVTEAAAETTEAAAEDGLPTQDLSGNDITVPEDVTKIVSMAPSVTRLLIDLGLSDEIIAVDTNSEEYYGDELPADLPTYDMMQPDNESIVALAPDIVFTSGMSSSGGTDVYASVRAAGICTADIPSASSLQEIEDSITFVGACTGTKEQAEEINSDFETAVSDIKDIGDAIPEDEKKTVLYEITTPTSDSPTIYSAGKDTYITEAITDIGATSLTADQEDAWPSISEEAAIAMNPDVILTTDNYTEDVVNTLLNLTGWENVTAVQNKDVYYIDANLLNQPNQHVISAMVEMAKDIYPDAYADLEDPFAQ
ncbi:MAG: ABC transporter substrate-binding protein [Lachnospiraceae bacterium]